MYLIVEAQLTPSLESTLLPVVTSLSSSWRFQRLDAPFWPAALPARAKTAAIIWVDALVPPNAKKHCEGQLPPSSEL
jgi:hypothetical protein